MKNIFPLLLAVVLFTACKNSNTQTTVDKTTTAKAGFAVTEKAELAISGMTCAVGCAGTIQKNLAKVDGVQSVTVDFDNRLAFVEYDATKLGISDLENTVHNTSNSYKVLDSKNVNVFEKANPKEDHHSKCSDDCKEDCCKNKKADTTKIMACKESCIKGCCANKA